MRVERGKVVRGRTRVGEGGRRTRVEVRKAGGK